MAETRREKFLRVGKFQPNMSLLGFLCDLRCNVIFDMIDGGVRSYK